MAPRLWKVGAANLNDAMQDAIPQLTLTPTDNANGTGDVLITVKDAAGNALAGRFAVNVWAGNADMAMYDVQEGFGIVAGSGVMQGWEENAWGLVITAADGTASVRLTLTGGGTRYVMASLGGRIVSTSLVITDP